MRDRAVLWEPSHSKSPKLAMPGWCLEIAAAARPAIAPPGPSASQNSASHDRRMSMRPRVTGPGSRLTW
jgi:hypothetical protein